jgi:site-specific recombinase XerD
MVKATVFKPTPQHELVLGIGATKCLNKFNDYLLRVKGVAPGTRTAYCFWVRRFLAAFCGSGSPDWSTLRGADLAGFVQNEAARLKRNGRDAPGVAMRAFVRYLIFLGVVRDGLQGAIPQRPRWRHVALPRYLPPTDVDRVVSGALDGTTRGRRNHAILLLLARTGLRAHEVAELSLDDIDWREGIINIRSKKSRSERRLPLAHDVGAALVDYLEHCRPPCLSRTIFLRVIPPFDPFTGSAGVCRLVRRALTRAGLLNTLSAAHLFRHTAATRMLRGGASFKEIADVLGHAAISTTAIYAKLDKVGLSRVAMPWPGTAP